MANSKTNKRHSLQMNQYAIDFDKGLLLGRAVKIVKKLAESPLADSDGEPIPEKEFSKIVHLIIDARDIANNELFKEYFCKEKLWLRNGRC